MAEPDFSMSPPIRRPAPRAKMTAYFAMLIIALVAMLVGCLFLYLEIRRFGGFGQVSGTYSAVENPAVAHHWRV